MKLEDFNKPIENGDNKLEKYEKDLDIVNKATIRLNELREINLNLSNEMKDLSNLYLKSRSISKDEFCQKMKNLIIKQIMNLKKSLNFIKRVYRDLKIKNEEEYQKSIKEFEEAISKYKILIILLDSDNFPDINSIY